MRDQVKQLWVAVNGFLHRLPEERPSTELNMRREIEILRQALEITRRGLGCLSTSDSDSVDPYTQAGLDLDIEDLGRLATVSSSEEKDGWIEVPFQIAHHEWTKGLNVIWEHDVDYWCARSAAGCTSRAPTAQEAIEHCLRCEPLVQPLGPGFYVPESHIRKEE